MFSRFPRDNKPRGGVESVALALCDALSNKRDIELHIITLERRLLCLEVQRFKKYTIHRVPGGYWPQMLDILCGPGRRRLKQYISHLKPDIVHMHETHGLTIGRLPAPVVFTVHGFDHANIVTEKQRFSTVRSLLWRIIEAYGLARHSYIVSISPYVNSQIQKSTNAIICTIDNPIDRKCFNVIRVSVKGRLFFAGWLSHRKNPLAIVRAMGILLKKGVSVHARFAGEEKDQSYAQILKNAIDQEGLVPHIAFLGRLGSDEIRDELSKAQVLVLPSLQENAPMVISEAMAAGVPVISSNRCGMPYMVEEGKTGFLVEPENYNALSDRIERLVTDDELNRSMGIAARASALNRFYPDVVAEKTLKFYSTILSDYSRIYRKQ
jgi:glycosyltransferase involved in cell wall biosynthesis